MSEQKSELRRWDDEVEIEATKQGVVWWSLLMLFCAECSSKIRHHEPE